MSIRALLNLAGDRLYALPLAIVYLTDRCNSRCVMCDYWQHGQVNLSLSQADRYAALFDRLGTRQVLLSGGEPLLHPEWAEAARRLAGGRRKLWLLTAGLALHKYAEAAAGLCQTITVSLDGATPETYRAVRGVDAFEAVCAGIREVVERGADVTLRCTVQSSNFRELPDLVDLAHRLGVRQISFLAVDVLTHVAFARRDAVAEALALDDTDLPEFEKVLERLALHCAEDFDSGFIAEPLPKLRRLHEYFAALQGGGRFPPVRCNAPRFSAVFTPGGAVQPCFFIAPAAPGTDLNGGSLVDLRREIRTGRRNECATCVCSMVRGPRALLAG